MHLFTATEYKGELTECDEGQLVWVPKDKLNELKLWEGDKIFFKLLSEDCGFFSLKLNYKGEKVTDIQIARY